MSVELPSSGPATVSVPAQALMPGTAHGTGSVFVLDTASSRIQRRAIKFGDTLLPDGRVPVTSGLAAGDQVVVAGTAFLAEGQAAIKHSPQTLLHGG